jgi:hypothetical protein
MDKEDARYQKLERLHERRKQVVRLHLRGTAVMQIVSLTGLSNRTLRNGIDLYKAGDAWPRSRPRRALEPRSGGQHQAHDLR